MTLAQLKRDAKSGTITAELQPEGAWKDGLPERLKGRRRLVGANTVGIFFLNADGRKSEATLPTAALTEYTADELIFYRPALRELNERERRIFDEWAKIAETEEYKERAKYDALTDGSSTYFQKKSFFIHHNAEYLLGALWENGCKYDYATGKVYDRQIRGEIDLHYKLYRTA